MVRTIASPSPAPPPDRASSPAGEALESALAATPSAESIPLVGNLDLDQVAVAARTQDHVAPAVAQGVVDQVAEGLAQAQRVGVQLEPGRRLDPERAAGGRGALGEAHPRRLELGGGVQALVSDRQRPVGGARQHQQVIGERGQAVTFRERLAKRLARQRAGIRGPHRCVELGADHRDRGAQLVRGVGHELPLPLERPAQPLEHLVERLAETADLVVRGGQRQQLVGIGQRHLAGAPAHRLDGRQARGRQRVADQRGEGKSDRAPDRKRREDARQRLLAILDRLPDGDHRIPTGPGTRQHPRLTGDSLDLPLEHDRACQSPLELRRPTAPRRALRRRNRSPRRPARSPVRIRPRPRPALPAATLPAATAADRVARPSSIVSVRSESSRVYTNAAAPISTTTKATANAAVSRRRIGNRVTRRRPFAGGSRPRAPSRATRPRTAGRSSRAGSARRPRPRSSAAGRPAPTPTRAAGAG